MLFLLDISISCRTLLLNYLELKVKIAFTCCVTLANVFLCDLGVFMVDCRCSIFCGNCLLDLISGLSLSFSLAPDFHWQDGGHDSSVWYGSPSQSELWLRLGVQNMSCPFPFLCAVWLFLLSSPQFLYLINYIYLPPNLFFSLEL